MIVVNYVSDCEVKRVSACSFHYKNKVIQTTYSSQFRKTMLYRSDMLACQLVSLLVSSSLLTDEENN